LKAISEKPEKGGNGMRICLITLVLALMTAGLALGAKDETLVLCLSFDDETTTDLSVYNNQCEPKGSISFTDGKFGKAIQFEPGSYVEIPTSDSLNPDLFKGEFTIAMWIKPTMTGDTWEHLWRSRPVQSGHNTLFINVNGTVSWRGMVGGNWTVLCETGAGTVKADEWTHVAVVSDKSNFIIYVNGEEAAKSKFQETDGNIQTYFLANDGISAERYAGAMDEVRVWNRALSKDEIVDTMNKGASELFPVCSIGSLPAIWGALKGR